MRALHGRDGGASDGRTDGDGPGTLIGQGPAPKTVVVQWDSGHEDNYRIGYEDKFDLAYAELQTETVADRRRAEARRREKPSSPTPETSANSTVFSDNLAKWAKSLEVCGRRWALGRCGPSQRLISRAAQDGTGLAHASSAWYRVLQFAEAPCVGELRVRRGGSPRSCSCHGQG